MTRTPFSYAESLRIGSVDFVSPDEVKVLLDIEAPESVALNVGTARAFPRVNGYVLLPVEDGYLVGQIEWLTIERSAFPKRKGMQDFGLVDLPYPLRKMSLNPLGTLRHKEASEDGYKFRRGADALPTVGSPVLLPTAHQLKAIVESGEDRRVLIGTSPLAGNAEVKIDPNRLFGRHLAVLGNTGSGKSCSVAGLVRWSLEAAQKACNKGEYPNARFIILDPNGEYSRAFTDADTGVDVIVLKTNSKDEASDLKVPVWFWNSAEWSSFTHATPKTQRPLLKRALREVKAGRTVDKGLSNEERKLRLRRYLSSKFISLQHDLHAGLISDKPTPFGFKLQAISQDLHSYEEEFSYCQIGDIKNAIEVACNASFKHFINEDGERVEFFRAFAEGLVNKIVEAITITLTSLGGIIYPESPDEDVPLPFKGSVLADHLQDLATQENALQYVEFLVSRIRTLLSDSRIKSIIDDTEVVTLLRWLISYLGDSSKEEAKLTIIDLSLVPAEIIHIITAVIARIIFEALQRYRKYNTDTLPTVLVMEEAHTFVKRYNRDAESEDTATVCCRVFERIAREGRKFGLGLVLSSQRPSELSPTVLSQCNTFLLHRISNDRDQDKVHRLVPDNLRGLLRELPSLPSQHAILLGWASELPLLVKMNDLPIEHQPHSADPDFWEVWTRRDANGQAVERKVDWEPITKDWQGEGISEAADTTESGNTEDTTVGAEAELPKPK